VFAFVVDAVFELLVVVVSGVSPCSEDF
jgi:hypothetical protein